MIDITGRIAQELGKNREHVENVIKLLDEGNTIPFIARYRKEMHGAMDDTALRQLDARLTYLRGLEERKAEVIRLIGEQGKLTPELQAQIEAADVMQRVEDLYKPFKQKRATRASKARERGLEPLAEMITAQKQETGTPLSYAAAFVDPEKEVPTPEDALQGACDIIAENIADDADLTDILRKKTFSSGRIITEAVSEDEKTVYDMYYGRTELLKDIPNHRILAVNRGEKEKKLKVRVEADEEAMLDIIKRRVVRNRGSIFAPVLRNAGTDAYKRLIAPSLEREMRNTLTERAEAEAVKVFAKNTGKLLMVPPVKNAGVISIDPGYRTGCKVAVLDGTGKLLAHTAIYPTPPRNDIAGAERTLLGYIKKYGSRIIVIGNGTASRETEEMVAGMISRNRLKVQYTIVNEAGASVYSASELAAKEYPDLDVTVRGAMSLGRRLQDPLAELVKIDPKHIGVGQYQHDINQKALSEALTDVVETCVNRVGVDLNTASASLLSYVSGINATIAKNIIAYREANGRFSTRKELLKVARFGPKAFEQSAGFLRITDGKESLDATSVHPESYGIARELMKKTGISESGIAAGGIPDIEKKIMEAYPAAKLSDSISAMAEALGTGSMTLSDIVGELKKPGRDPREDAPPVVFRNDVRSFEDLKEGMELTGTVRNVVDFGAFVDIGVKQDGLVHISKMSRSYIKHPMDVVSIGDTVRVRILSVDHEKKKISLSMTDL